MEKNTSRKIVFIFFLIIGLAVFSRFWQLDSIPPGLWPDEAMNANDAFYTLESGDYKLFYPDNNGREGLFMWLISLSFSLFGISVWALKVPPAVAGVLTVVGIFFLTKELFLLDTRFIKEKIHGIYLSLATAFLLSTSFWHINFSRISFRAILAPLLLVFSFFFLLKGFRTRKIYNFIFSGLFLGIGLHTYISFRIAPVIFAVLLIIFFFSYLQKKELRKYLIFSLIFLVFAFVAALPMLQYFLGNMEDFTGRTGQVSVFDAQEPVKELIKSTTLHLGMFNVFGDPNWRHNYSGHPMIPLPLGLFFLIGLFYSIKKFFVSLKEKEFHPLILYSLLLSWFFIMLLPGILTTEGIPHALRIISVIPPVYILTVMGGYLFYLFLCQRWTRKAAAVFLVFIAIACAGIEINKYFFDWAKNPEVEKAFTKNYVEIGNHLNSLPEESRKYVVINEPGSPIHGISISAQTPMFIEKTAYGKTRAEYIRFEELEDKLVETDETIFIIPLYGEHTANRIRENFPDGEMKKENRVFIYQINSKI